MLTGEDLKKIGQVVEGVFEPHAISIQKDLTSLKSDVGAIKYDVADAKGRLTTFENEWYEYKHKQDQ
jgi:hypothetical protein